MEDAKRESIEFDVVIVGGGPAGLAAACQLMQLANKTGSEFSVCLVEKGAEIGAHTLSGAIFEPTALNELFPDWQERGAPLTTPVTEDYFFYLVNDVNRIRIPDIFIPKPSHNVGNYVLSLGNFCRWLGEQAEALGVNIFAGFAAQSIIYNDDGSVGGVLTGDMGVNSNGTRKPNFQAGYELRAKYVLFCEGCRGHLGKQLIQKFDLARASSAQHYAIGLKELWDMPANNHAPGRVLHTVGWPLGHGSAATGGSFLYHLENNQIAVGLIVDLSYKNPYMNPFLEFQRFKQHPLVRDLLADGQRISYGARAIVKGGLNALPKLSLPGALIAGDDAGFLNPLKIKGSHTAMKSGMLAASAIFNALQSGSTGGETLLGYEKSIKKSWVYKELYAARNTGPALHKAGVLLGAAYTWIEQKFFDGKVPYTLTDNKPDHDTLISAELADEIAYPKPDGKVSFDLLSSVYLANTTHEEDQPCHLQLEDPSIPTRQNLPQYAEPAQRYCPAGVYEVVSTDAGSAFVINAQNCVHCKTCDIKDPAQNITWVAPEGGGGPGYPNM